MKNRKWVILTLTILFIFLSISVKFNWLENIDNLAYSLITLNINSLITSTYKIITFLGSTKFIIFLCIFFLVLFVILKKKNIGFIVTGSIIVSTIVNNLLKIIVMRERPNVLKFVHESSYSFPSGHTMAAVTMYGILMYIVLKSNLNKKLKIFLAVLLGFIPILVGLSRVYLGAHFITDVVGAFIVSIILLLIETYYIDKNEWI